MKKIKISELPLYQSLKGLFTIGTDADNRSVKVSLEFIETQTQEAVKGAETATAAANKAAGLADEATTAAKAAADEATTAAAAATKATAAATEAAQSAVNSSGVADKSAAAADKATAAATAAQQAAEKATELSDEATTAAETATAAANKATEETLKTIGIIVPTGLTVSCLSRLTYGNVQPVYINAVLSPETAMKNIIYISDNKSLEVGLDGRLTITGKGYSRVYVIPTCNTALAKTLLIEVGDPTLRLVNTRKQLRLTSSGALRLN